MSKLFIFDLDGVLINSREMHFHALNNALKRIDPNLVITMEEHLSTYDGRPTREKLRILTSEKDLQPMFYDEIFRLKQEETVTYLTKSIQKSPKLETICTYLWSNDYDIAVASNAVRSTVETALTALGIRDFITFVQSNQDVKHPKPYPEMYWNCMRHFKALPKDTVIVEDSHIGRQGALDSGAHLLAVINQDDLTLDKVVSMVEGMKNNKVPAIKWRDPQLNVLIPMAGAGSRFAQAGYTFPKPLIDVNGKPMIQTVVENLNLDANYIFIVQQEHYDKYNLKYMLNMIAPGCKIIPIEGVTEGAACTTLLAEEFIDNTHPLVIANSDQFVEWNSNEVMYSFTADQIDGGILTFKSVHPKWSYAKVGNDGFVSEVAEKKPISDNATVGIYYWKWGSDYVRCAHKMINKNIRTNGEFYVAPVFNEAIEAGKRIKVKQIERMWGLGTPEDLRTFLEREKD